MEAISAAHDFITGLFVVTGAFVLCVGFVMAGIWVKDVNDIIKEKHTK